MLHALAGVRVVDLTRILAGPFGTMILADLGADVIKVERTEGGDDTRTVGPHFMGGESVYFMSVNRGKRSVAIDLAAPEGRAVLLDLVRASDVVVQNFRPSVRARLGCDDATLRSANPRVIVCSMTAVGSEGDERDVPAFDLTVQARGGTMGLTGEPGRMPVRAGPPIGDLAGGLYLAIAVSAALVERARTGTGTSIDLSLLDCQASLLVYAAAFYLNAGVVLGPQGSGHANAFPYGAFETADAPIVVAVFTDRFWPGFCAALGFGSWGSDAAYATTAGRLSHRDVLIPAIQARLRERGAEAWLDALRTHDVPASRVQSIADVARDPQLLARGMIATSHHATAGAVRTVGNPIKLGTDWHDERHAAAPRHGEHTDEVLRDVVGYDSARIAALRERGRVGRRPRVG